MSGVCHILCIKFNLRNTSDELDKTLRYSELEKDMNNFNFPFD